MKRLSTYGKVIMVIESDWSVRPNESKSMSNEGENKSFRSGQCYSCMIYAHFGNLNVLFRFLNVYKSVRLFFQLLHINFYLSKYWYILIFFISYQKCMSQSMCSLVLFASFCVAFVCCICWTFCYKGLVFAVSPFRNIYDQT